MANMAVPAGNLDTTTALIYDSVHAFALALNELTEVQQVRQKPLECSGKTAWAHGNSLINYMKLVRKEMVESTILVFNSLDIVLTSFKK